MRPIVMLALCCGLLAVPAAHGEEIRVGGTILAPGGEPLAEVEVRLVPLLDTLGEARAALRATNEVAEPAARAVSNARGRFTLAAPHAGLWSVRIDAPGFVPVMTALEPLIDTVELPAVELTNDAGMTVRVIDSDGEPVSGALVLLRTARPRFGFGSSGHRPVLRGARTDDDGSARLPRGETERPTITVSAAGFVSVEQKGASGTGATVRLERGTSRTVEVVSHEGRAEAGVLVALGRSPHPVGETDAAGRLSLRIDRAVPTPLVLVAGDGRRIETRLVPAAEQDSAAKPTRFELPPRLLVAGRLVDALSRKPIEGALVWDRGNPAESAVTDRAGGFVLGGPALARLQITVGAPGYVGADSHEFQLADDGRPGPTLALKPAAAVTGRVVDASGEPVEGADARLEVKRNPGMMRIEIGGRTELPRALSDAAGKFRLGRIDPDKSYTLKVSADGYAVAEQTIDDLEPYLTESGLSVRLSRGQGLVGTVVDADGHPLADALIRAEPASSGHGMRMMRFVEAGSGDAAIEATTGTDGRFELLGMAAGTFDLKVERPGFARRDVPAVELEADAEPRDLGEIALERGERVQGFVFDRDGLPVEGARIKIGEAGPMMVMMSGPGADAGPEPDAITDPTGWFVVEDLARGKRYDLGVSRTGYVDGGAATIEVPRLEPVEITLQPASRVVGLVLDPEGEPIVGAQVNMTRSRTMEMGGNVMQMMMMMDETTDVEGRFVFEDQEPGSISLSASASGFQEAKLDNLEIPKGEDLEGIELPLQSGAIVQGRITAPDGRAAIGASVQVVSESPGTMLPDMGSSPSDGNGVYRLEGLAPGTVSIEATHPDYPRAVRDLEVSEGINSLDLAFEGGHAVSGTIVDETGTPVGGAAVRLVAVGRFWGGPETQSSRDGTFDIPGVQDGDYRAWVDAEGFASSSGDVPVRVEGEPLAGISVTLTPGASLHGTIRGLEPERFSGVSVSTEGAGFGGFGGARVDYEGNYRLEHLSPGSYTVVASLDGSGRQAQATAVLEAGMTELRVDLEFGHGLTLSGRAVQASQPVTGASVFVEGVDVTRTGWSQTGRDGEFSVEGLEPGSYDVHLRNWQTGLAYTEQVELGTSREVVLEVPTARVAGRIVDAADRQPLAGVMITLSPTAQEDSRGLPAHSATTDLEGRFELGNLADGSWRLAATKQGYAAREETVTVQFEKSVADLRLEMEATEGLTLLTSLPGGSSPTEVRVAVLDAAGAAVASGNYATGENGRVRLSSVPPGAWDVVISAAGAATSSFRAEAPGAAVPVALEPATALRVRVPELIGSDVLATVTLLDANNRPFRGLGWNGRPRSEWRLGGGEIEFASLPPGSWQVSVSTADGRSWKDNSVTAPGGPAELVLK